MELALQGSIDQRPHVTKGYSYPNPPDRIKYIYGKIQFSFVFLPLSFCQDVILFIFPVVQPFFSSFSWVLLFFLISLRCLPFYLTSKAIEFLSLIQFLQFLQGLITFCFLILSFLMLSVLVFDIFKPVHFSCLNHLFTISCFFSPFNCISEGQYYY